jgi:hypothetical protein
MRKITAESGFDGFMEVDKEATVRKKETRVANFRELNKAIRCSLERLIEAPLSVLIRAT